VKGNYSELVAFYLAALAIRTSYELLKKAGRLDSKSRTRHPMYLGFILWILGWAAFHGAVVSLAVGLVGIGNFLLWRHRGTASGDQRRGSLSSLPREDVVLESAAACWLQERRA
jgi:uncharacterized membrane protein